MDTGILITLETLKAAYIDTKDEDKIYVIILLSWKTTFRGPR